MSNNGDIIDLNNTGQELTEVSSKVANNTNNTQLCDDSQACNYNQEGSCERPPENYNCTGSWTGDFCGAASACNTGSRATCDYPDSDRVDCDGNPLYCEDSQACNYNELLNSGSCERPPENYNCTGSWTGDFCGAASACNTGSRATCDYPDSDRVDCDGNPLYCEDSQAMNYGSVGNYISGEASVFNNMSYVTNNNNKNNVMIDENGNTVTMTQEQLQALINKVSNLQTSFQNYTTGEFQVNDRYYTTTGELLSYNSPDAPQVQLIPGKDIIDEYEVKYEESQQPNMTYDDDTHVPFNYYYKQNTDPNVAYPYDTNEVPIKKPDTKYPFFENRFDRPTNFDGKSHTYMHPQNWRYPEQKASKCQKQNKPNEPVYLDKSYISLNDWNSHIGTILPDFTYKENKY
jgi:hypothetical protein